jgi:hypothetical protein
LFFRHAEQLTSRLAAELAHERRREADAENGRAGNIGPDAADAVRNEVPGHSAECAAVKFSELAYIWTHARAVLTRDRPVLAVAMASIYASKSVLEQMHRGNAQLERLQWLS